jgi:hypothetical protein
MASSPSTAPSRRRLRDSAILQCHRLADRFELLPPEFGERAQVDEGDPDAVLAEWVRCVRQWADYSPEQVFALKVGGGLFIATLVGLLLLVGALA